MDKYKKYEPIFGEWTITKLLGEGSFGKVYEMERNDFGRTYKAALKIITIPTNESEIRNAASEGMNDNSIYNYFMSCVEQVVEEFSIMSKLKGNSHIVSYENHKVIPHENGIGWDILIQMELLIPLDEYFSSHDITKENVLKLGIDICQALQICHKYNIVHRDIKPENIFVSPIGDFKLGDFGIARTVEKTINSMSKKGTYSYMAPEVYKGENYDFSVDIYSLGMVLYRLLNNNRLPFLPPYPNPIRYSDKDVALSRRMRGEKIEKPINADSKLANVVLKAIAYLPSERYASCEEMRRDLELILEREKKHIGNKRELKRENDDVNVKCDKEEKTLIILNTDSDDTNIIDYNRDMEAVIDGQNFENDVVYQEVNEIVPEVSIDENNHKKKKIIIISMIIGVLICSIFVILGESVLVSNNESVKNQTDKTQSIYDEVVENPSLDTEKLEEQQELSIIKTEKANNEENVGTEVENKSYPYVLEFKDEEGAVYSGQVIEKFPKTLLVPQNFEKKDGVISYQDDNYFSKQGIDVSYHQGDIDWRRVKNSGIEFAIIRLGLRRYGQEGKLELDKCFVQNIEAAQAVGIDIGIYFFSQAVSEYEAREEADFVIKNLTGYNIQLPIYYVIEKISNDDARTDNISGYQFTQNAIAFCERIKEAGYSTAIYANTYWEFLEFELERLQNYEIWYADYSDYPQTPYAYSIWQYTGAGKVEGITTNVDRDILLQKK